MGIFDFWRSSSEPLQIEGPTEAPPSSGDDSLRMDSVGAFINTIAALGGSDDSGASVKPSLSRVSFSVEHWQAAYEGGLYGRIIDMDPDDAFSKGFEVKVEGDEDFQISRRVMDRLEDLDVNGRVQQALKIGAALGEARLWSIVDGGAQDLTTPWDPDRTRKFHALHLLGPQEFSPVQGDGDLRSPLWGQPSIYRLTPSRAWQGYDHGAKGYEAVHASRLLRAYGFDTPYSSRAGMDNGAYPGAALPWGQRWWDVISQNVTVDHSAARAAAEISVAVFGMDQGAFERMNRGGSSGANRMVARLQNIRLKKSIANMIALLPGESYERRNISIAGFDQLDARALKMLCAVTGKSEAQLLGQPPGGLTADKGSWWAKRELEVSTYQKERCNPILRPIIRALLAELGHGGRPFKIAWHPLAEQTPEQKSTTYLRTMQATALAINAGIIPPDHGRHHFGVDGFMVDLPPVEEEDLEDEATEDMGTVEAVQRAVRAAVPKPSAEAVDAEDENVTQTQEKD